MPNLASWHFNPETGKPGRCRAKTRCRFNLSSEEHFSSQKEVLAHVEKALCKSSGGLPEPARKSNNPNQALVDQLDGLLKSAPTDFEAMSSFYGGSDVRTKDSGFKYLAKGGVRRVYLHAETGKVFKVFREDKFSEESAKILTREEQESYASFDIERLAKANIRYLETEYYKSSSGSLYAVQKYLDPMRYRPAEWGSMTEEQELLLSELEADNANETGYNDFTEENAVIDSQSGELILIDCLYTPSRINLVIR